LRERESVMGWTNILHTYCFIYFLNLCLRGALPHCSFPNATFLGRSSAAFPPQCKIWSCQFVFRNVHPRRRKESGGGLFCQKSQPPGSPDRTKKQSNTHAPAKRKIISHSVLLRHSFSIVRAMSVPNVAWQFKPIITISQLGRCCYSCCYCCPFRPI
jgi:hypothetical protein